MLLAVCAARAPTPTQADKAPAPLYLLLEPMTSERAPTPTPTPMDELPVFRPLRQDHPHRAALERTLASPYLRWVLEVGKQARDRARLRCGADADCARRPCRMPPACNARLHEAGHRMDIEAFKRMLQEASPEMEQSAARLAAHPELLEDAAAPELWLRNDALKLHLPLLGIEEQPLDFDLNAAPVELLRTIPGATYQEAVAIDQARRQRRGFRSVDDLAAVPSIRPQTADAIQELRSSFLAAAGP